MGSGKSYWGRRVADALDFKFIDLDDYLEKKLIKAFQGFLKKKENRILEN